MRHDEFIQGMDFSGPEKPLSDRFGEFFHSLHRLLLLQDFDVSSDLNLFRKKYHRDFGDAGGGYVAFCPTTIGVQLFMWSMGVGQEWQSYDQPGHSLEAIPDVYVPSAKRQVELPVWTSQSG